MLTIHKIADGAYNTIGWCVLEDKMRTVAEFKTVEEACAFVKGAEETVARFPLAVIRSALEAKMKNLSNPQAICSMKPPVNVHCGSDPLIGWVGVSANFWGGYWGVSAYITATGFAFPA